MTQYIQRPNGTFAGSIGDGKANVPTAKPATPAAATPTGEEPSHMNPLAELYARFHAQHGRAPVIGLDLDGTTADLVGTLRAQVAQTRGIPAEQAEQALPDPDNYSMWHATGAWYEDMDDFVSQFKVAEENGIYRELRPYDGAREVLTELHEAGFEIHAVTARSAEYNPDTQAWLDTHQIPTRGIKNPGTAKHTIPEVDVFIDDAPHVIRTLGSNDRSVLVFDQLYNAQMDLDEAKTRRIHRWDLHQVTAALAHLLGRSRDSK